MLMTLNKFSLIYFAILYAITVNIVSKIFISIAYPLFQSQKLLQIILSCLFLLVVISMSIFGILVMTSGTSETD